MAGTSRAVHFVRTGFGPPRVGTEQGLERSSVSPPAFENFIREFVFFDVKVVDVGYFELAAAGRFQAPDFFEDSFVVQIDSDDRIVRFGRFGFLFDAHNALPLDLSYAKA